MDRLAHIREILGEPYYERDGCLVYNRDCIESLDRLEASCKEQRSALFDLTVTSPPYNIGKEYETVKPLDEYLDWCGRWMRGIHALTRPQGSFWLNVGYVSVPGKGNAVPLPYLLYNRCPFFLHQEVVWHYGAGVACKRQFSPRNEKLLWYVKDATHYTFNLDDVRDPNVKYPNQRKNGVLRCNPLGKNPTDVWDIPKVTSGRGRASAERTPHPAQFPEAVIERVIRASSDRGDLVLDPFLGSGTTAKVALEHGRLVVGFELDRGYCDIIVKRLRGYATECVPDGSPLQDGAAGESSAGSGAGSGRSKRKRPSSDSSTA